MANTRQDRPSKQAWPSSANDLRDKSEEDRTAAIVATFRTLGLESAEARERIQRLANPAGLEIGCEVGNRRLETRNNTLPETGGHCA